MNGTPIASRAVSRKAAPRRSETKQLRRPAITDAGAGRANNSRHVTPDSLSQMLADFLEGARAAVVVEDGAIVFDLAESKYSISGEYHKCLLHLWSSERNLVRRVLDAEVKTTTLRLQVQRMGQNRPTRLDFCRDRDRRSPAAGAREKFSRLDRRPAHHKHGSRTLLWSGLPARVAAPGTARPCHRGSERPGNAIDRR